MDPLNIFAGCSGLGLDPEAEHKVIKSARRAASRPVSGPITWTEYLARFDWFLTFYGRREGLQ